jgi:hypothetical protein
MDPKSSTSKQEFTGFDRVYTRRMTKQKIKQFPEVKFDLDEKTPQVNQSKRGKGKQPVTYPSRPKTRPTNKLRQNSKVIFKPSLKEDNLIILDEKVTDLVPKKTRKGKKLLLEPDIVSSHSGDKMEPDPTYVPEMYELLEVDTQEIQFFSKYAEKEIIKESPSNEPRYRMRSRKPKISIDLNRPAPEEDYGGCREETEDAPKNKKIKKFHTVIKELNFEKQALEFWKDKLQDKVEKLKAKNKEPCELSNKVGKMNINLYWRNVVLKTNLKQENSKSRCRFKDQVLDTST